MKKILFGTIARPFTVKTGIGRGLRIHFNPQSEASKIVGFYETEIQKYFKAFAKKSNLLLDIGSFDGYYSLIYRKYNPQGEILACEAGSMVINRIVENYQRNFNNSNHFTVVNKFIGENTSDSQTTVDDLVKGDSSVSKIFLKIDVEGAELSVLKGAENTLKNKTCILIIETHSLELEKNCITFLENTGYKVTIIKNHPFTRIFRRGRLLNHNRWLTAKK